MKRRNVSIGLIAALVIIVAGWGALNLWARMSNQMGSSLDPAIAANGATATKLATLYRTGTQIIPTVEVSSSTAHCDSKHIPVSTDPTQGAGPTAIQPHLCSIPTYTEQDVLQYMSKMSKFESLRIVQRSPHFIVTCVLFVTNKVADDFLDAGTKAMMSDDNRVVCYVEVYGDFIVPSPFSHSTTANLLHHGEIVFDGLTGNQINIGAGK